MCSETESDRTVARIINERLAVLYSKTFDELKSLSNESEEVAVARSKMKISIWHNFLNQMEQRIVVQVYKPGPLGIGRMYAKGFIINQLAKKGRLHRASWLRSHKDIIALAVC